MVLEPYLYEQKGKVHGNINRSDSYNSSLAFIVPIFRIQWEELGLVQGFRFSFINLFAFLLVLKYFYL